MRPANVAVTPHRIDAIAISVVCMRLGVLDVGSNTVHLLIVDAHAGGAPAPASSTKLELRLAERLEADSSIGQAAVDELCTFITRSLIISADTGVTELLAFATSAVRDAPNMQTVLATVKAHTGVALRVLAGDDEAKLTFLAARRWFGWSSGRLMVVDIGGGSLEVAVGGDEEPHTVASCRLGAGWLTRRHLRGDPPGRDEVRELRRLVREEIAATTGRLLRFGHPELAVATSKTLRQLTRLAAGAATGNGRYPLRDSRRALRRDDLSELLPRLARMSTKARAALPGVSAGRAHQLVAGAVVAEATMDLLGLDELVACPWALREGLILRWLDSLGEPVRRRHATSVAALSQYRVALAEVR